MKRTKIEIIIPSAYLHRLIQTFEELAITGYSVLEISKGKGAKEGETYASGAIAGIQNMLVFTICTQEERERLVQKIAHPIKSLGGLIIEYEVQLC
ncbi:MAG: hypothetical protein RML72_04345 [Bacteroidia bacterium]|nr:hypothetical protein [Bacteroidia bacterium]MDW8158093.1 hypothetical protein [Bacteroidia bacterium]